jgi:hypothetical protein
MEGLIDWLKLEAEIHYKIFPTLYDNICRHYKYFELGNLQTNQIFYPKLFIDYYDHVLHYHIRTLLDSLKKMNQNYLLSIKTDQFSTEFLK